MPKDFYVYIHRKATTGEVFYVGKGKKCRAWNTERGNLHWKNTVKKHGHVVEIVRDGLQEWAAFELQCELIALHGRKDLGLGPLVNLTDGGDGTSGAIDSPETRLKKSLNSGSRRPEVKVQIAVKAIEMWQKDGFREKMSERHKGERNGMFGKTHKEESVAIIIKKASAWGRANASFLSNVAKAQFATEEARLQHGQICKLGWTEEVKQQHSQRRKEFMANATDKQRMKGQFSPYAKPVVSECGLFFWAAKEASRDGHGNVNQAAKRGCKAKGKKWRYATQEEIEAHKKAAAF